jgi:hypothetical protein
MDKKNTAPNGSSDQFEGFWRDIVPAMDAFKAHLKELISPFDELNARFSPPLEAMEAVRTLAAQMHATMSRLFSGFEGRTIDVVIRRLIAGADR